MLFVSTLDDADLEEDDAAAATSPLASSGAQSHPVQGTAHASAAASGTSLRQPNGAATYIQFSQDDDEELDAAGAAGDDAEGYSEVEFSSDDGGTSAA